MIKSHYYIIIIHVKKDCDQIHVIKWRKWKNKKTDKNFERKVDEFHALDQENIMCEEVSMVKNLKIKKIKKRPIID